MRRRAILAALGAVFAARALFGPSRRPRTARRVEPDIRPPWLRHPRPRPPDSLYENGLSDAERRVAAHKICACTDPHPWEYRHADPIGQTQRIR